MPGIDPARLHGDAPGGGRFDLTVDRLYGHMMHDVEPFRPLRYHRMPKMPVSMAYRQLFGTASCC
jgi:hypothetical protein